MRARKRRRSSPHQAFGVHTSTSCGPLGPLALRRRVAVVDGMQVLFRDEGVANAIHVDTPVVLLGRDALAVAGTLDWCPFLIGSIDDRSRTSAHQCAIATVERGKAVSLTISGKAIEATPYTASGGLEHEVWFDGTGLWVKWRPARDGGTISLIRE